jgi:uncharacterized protein
MARASMMRGRVAAIALAALVFAGLAAIETARAATPTPIPAAPTAFVTDRAGFLTPAYAAKLTKRLEDYERGTGHQVIVWIDKTTGGVPIDDWAVKAFAAWGVGRKGHDDGVAMFIFSEDRKMRIEVGYGLEGNVPDARAGRIITNDMAPRIRNGDRDGAVEAGVNALLAAIGGAPEPKRSNDDDSPDPGFVVWLIAVAVMLLSGVIRRYRHPRGYTFIGGGGWGGGGGGWGGGGGGGFSGGGGSSGGGGASGGW